MAEIVQFVILAHLATLSHAQQAFFGENNANLENSPTLCVTNVCLNGGTCYIDQQRNTFDCACLSGFTGQLCESKVRHVSLNTTTDPCKSVSCLNGGTCMAVGSVITVCRCMSGYTGVRCENVATVSNPCLQLDCGPSKTCIQSATGPICVTSVEPTTSTTQAPFVSMSTNIDVDATAPVTMMCKERPCFNDGKCISSNLAPGYICECPVGWTGVRCEQDVKECSTSPCSNNGTCMEFAGGFVCRCLDGFTGQRCETNIDDCENNPCQHDGICIDGIHSFICNCQQEWDGLTCERPYDVCNSDPCENNGVCNSLLPSSNQFSCTCLPGFSGSNCEENINDCIGVTCPEIGQICVDLIESYECRCPEGWSGNGCVENIDECLASPCKNGATCIDIPGNYTCQCIAGFTGPLCDDDIDECNEIRPCIHGICTNLFGSYKCYCEPGFLNSNCSFNFDECYSSPCLNDGICIDSANRYTCLCPYPFTGDNCQHIREPCDGNPCENGGTCVPQDSGYVCFCPSGIIGSQCETITDPCTPNPCAPGGCLLSKDTPSGFECNCLGTGLDGPLCDEAQTQKPQTDICAEFNCQNGGAPLISPDGAVCYCLCHPGYQGNRCQIGVVDCLTDSCLNGGTCIERSNKTAYELGLISGPFDYSNSTSFICICPAGISGRFCQDVQPGCDPNPCSNSALCIPSNGSFTCNCPSGFTGYNCEQDMDECSQNPCIQENTEICVNLKGGFRCRCLNGWAGDKCEIRLAGCDGQVCEVGECIPFLTPDRLHSYRCKCPNGKTGITCEIDTTAGFKGDSLLAYISNTGVTTDYNLKLSLKTTLPDALLVAGDDVLSRSVYDLWLKAGKLKLDWQGVETVTLNDGLQLNDAKWHSIELNYSNSEVTLSLLDETWNALLSQSGNTSKSLPVFSTKFGGRKDETNIIGCLRDMKVNEKFVIPEQQLATSLNVELGCQRSEQCSVDSCAQHGKCDDLWNSYKCQCDRPYLPPDCVASFPEGTFGYGKNRSYTQVELSQNEQEGLELKTDISMLIRTREKEGMIAYIGSEANVNPDLDTFIALELVEGQLQARVKLGPTEIKTFVGGPKLDDGKVHSIRVSRNENSLQGYVDEKLVFEGKLENHFAYPLLATYFFVGGYPLPFPDPTGRVKRQLNDGTKDVTEFDGKPKKRVVIVNAEAFTTAKTFKGTIQDVKLNGYNVAMFPINNPDGAPVDAPQMGKSQLNSVVEGTVSDVTCDVNPCKNGAQCDVTFNDYECTCVFGWRGRNCSIVDHCVKPGICPGDATCQNTDNGYICLSAGTFLSSSYVKYSLSIPDGSSVPMFYTFSLNLRTRSDIGAIMYAFSGNQFILLEVNLGRLHLKYRLGDSVVDNFNLTQSINITDGQWHHLKLTLLTEQSYINVDNNTEVFYLDGQPTVPLSDIFTSNGTLFIGAIPNDPSLNLNTASSIDGCIKNVTFGTELVPLSFYSESEYGSPGVAHFKPNVVNFVRSGCHPRPQCIEPDPVNGQCLNNATCDDLWNAVQCNCVPGFEGRYCEININDCNGHRCTDNGTCIDGIQDYTCDCFQGFTGVYCETEINECDPSPCVNDGVCHDLVGKFDCVCGANYTGSLCEILITVDCKSNPCHHGARCEDVDLGNGFNTFNCLCLPGYTGKACEHEIDYCIDTPCINGATCVSHTQLLNYECQCAEGYTGTNCETDIDECSSQPCINNGQCMDRVGAFFCQCQTGWTGSTCDVDIDECLSGPCLNGANCINTLGSFQCTCPTYYLGEKCEIRGSCLSNPCLNGTCIQISADQHRCECGYGYEGDACDREIDYCASFPCQNDATCQRPVNGPGFECICPPGITGQVCSIDIDECISAPCLNNGICKNLRNEYRCDCTGTGFLGLECGQDVDECALPDKCINGKCVNKPGDYSCDCTYGYIGKRCNHLDPCMETSPNGTNRSRQQILHRCENLAKCQNARVDLKETEEEVLYDCICAEGYEGSFCEIPVDRAAGLPLTYIIGPILGALLLICIIGGMAFLMMARKKRATTGAYSPSRQEMTGARVQMGHMMKPPPEERLI